MSDKPDSKEEVREIIRTMRKEVQKITRELATATQAAVDSSRKAVHEVSPKVTATVDETIRETSAAFRRAMAAADKQTKGQQASLLRTYKSLLLKQVDFIEKRLRKIAQ